MSGVFSFLATLVALVFLLFPFTFLTVWSATTISFIVGTILAFLLGMYIGKLGDLSVYKGGLKYALITIMGAGISYAVGELLHMII